MKSRLALSFFFISACTLTTSAAVWQYQRATSKYTREQAVRESMQRPVPNFTTWANRIETSDRARALLLPHQRVRVTGQYLSGRDMLIDNRFYQHRVGFEVVSPFRVQGSDHLLLVNRGWIEKKQSDLKKLSSPATTNATLRCVIDKIWANPFILSRHEQAPKWSQKGQHPQPALQLQLRPGAIAQALGHPVYPFQCRLDAGQRGALTHNWQPVVLSWQRHTGYAVQWALLAMASAVMLIIVNRKRPYEHKRKQTR